LTFLDATQRYSALLDAIQRYSTLLGRQTWPADLDGRLGRQTWLADMAGRLGRQTLLADLLIKDGLKIESQHCFI
jgi:hypothetical protein